MSGNSPRLAGAIARHRAGALMVTGLALLLVGPATRLDTGVQAAWLGVGTLLTGVPHGAVDHLRMAARRMQRTSPAWWSAFVCGYAAVAVAVAGLWWLLPLPSLCLFLLLSVHHFGAGDADDGFGVLVHGSLPILIPAATHPDAVGGLFASLTGASAADWRLTLHTAQPLLLAVALLLLTTRLWSRRAAPRGERLELLAIATTGALLPPLLAFALYFCVWHAPRHILHVAHELWPGPLPRALARFGVATLPMTLTTLVASGLAFCLLSMDAAVSERWLQVLFVGLAALTVPHLLVTAALQRSRGSSESLRGAVTRHG